jgi:hypothetical protein
MPATARPPTTSISGATSCIHSHNAAFMLHTMRAVQDWLHLDTSYSFECISVEMHPKLHSDAH